MDFDIRRRITTMRSTIGTLAVDGFHRGYVLEPPWRGGRNAPKLDAILPGRYRATIEESPGRKRKRDIDGPLVFLLHDVPGRDLIQMHPGNFPGNTEGCLLPGRAFGHDVVLESRPLFRELRAEGLTALGHGEEIFFNIANAFETAQQVAALEI